MPRLGQAVGRGFHLKRSLQFLPWSWINEGSKRSEMALELSMGKQTGDRPPDWQVHLPSLTSSAQQVPLAPNPRQESRSRLKTLGNHSPLPCSRFPSKARPPSIFPSTVPHPPKKRFSPLKTPFYLLQLEIHGGRHLDALYAPARWENAGKRVGEGRALTLSAVILRLCKSQTPSLYPRNPIPATLPQHLWPVTLKCSGFLFNWPSPCNRSGLTCSSTSSKPKLQIFCVILCKLTNSLVRASKLRYMKITSTTTRQSCN